MKGLEMAVKLDTCQVAAVRVDTPWTKRGGVVACVASLTRRLSRQESRGMARFPEFSVTGDRVAYECRPSESEAFEKRLSAVLRSLHDPDPGNTEGELPLVRDGELIRDGEGEEGKGERNRRSSRRT